MNKPTHFWNNLSSCIDLIVTSQPNLITHSGVDPSLYPNCHHQIVFSKFSLKICFTIRTVSLALNNANIDLIRWVIDLFDWERAFSNRDINKQVSLFNETLTNIFENYYPHEIVTCNDKDLAWLRKTIKVILTEKNLF